jgi:hypothetical protein
MNKCPTLRTLGKLRRWKPYTSLEIMVIYLTAKIVFLFRIMILVKQYHGPGSMLEPSRIHILIRIEEFNKYLR